jgi:hypothetical protein
MAHPAPADHPGRLTRHKDRARRLRPGPLKGTERCAAPVPTTGAEGVSHSSQVRSRITRSAFYDGTCRALTTRLGVACEDPDRAHPTAAEANRWSVRRRRAEQRRGAREAVKVVVQPVRNAGADGVVGEEVGAAFQASARRPVGPRLFKKILTAEMGSDLVC